MKPQDILLAIAVPVIWGLGFTLSKAALDQFPPILLVAFRFTLTAVVLVWFFKPPWPSMGRIFVIALSSAVVQYSLTYTGLKGLDVSTAAIVVQLEVPFAALLASIFLKDHLGWRRILGMALAFVGIGLIAGEPQIQQNWTPAMLVASGALAWAVGQVLIKTLGGQVSGFTLLAWVAVIASPNLFLSSFLFESGQLDAIVNADWRGWAVVIYLGLIMNGIGYAIWYHLLGRHEVNQVMPFLLLVPVTSVIGGVTLLDERLTLLVGIGGAIVIAGIGIITLRRPRLAGPYTELSIQPEVRTPPAEVAPPEPGLPLEPTTPVPVSQAAIPPPPPSVVPAGPTVEGLLRDSLQPLLREWVDANLPGLVRHMIGREIRDVARRAEDG